MREELAAERRRMARLGASMVASDGRCNDAQQSLKANLRPQATQSTMVTDCRTDFKTTPYQHFSLFTIRSFLPHFFKRRYMYLRPRPATVGIPTSMADLHRRYV